MKILDNNKMKILYKNRMKILNKEKHIIIHTCTCLNLHVHSRLLATRV